MASLEMEIMEPHNADEDQDEETDLDIFTAKSDYDYSIGSIILHKYRGLLFLTLIILLCFAMNKIDPYSDAFTASYSIFILFGYWWLALENIMALYCILPVEKAKIASIVIATIYIIESIIAAINPESIFGVLFTLQAIATNFMSIYASCFLLYLHKMKKPLVLFIILQMFFLFAKLYSLSLRFVYIHNDVTVTDHSTPTPVYLTMWGLTNLILASEVVIDKLDFITGIIYVQKQNVYTNFYVQIVFITLLCIVFLVSVILYLVYDETHIYNETDGYYPYAVWIEFIFYWNFPIVFAWIIWMLFSRIYIYHGKVSFGTMKTEA